MITEESIEKSLDYLRDTASDLSEAHGAILTAEAKMELIESTYILEPSDETVAAKKAQGRSTPEFQEARKQYIENTMVYDKIKALREAADLRIRAWQTQQSSMRQGFK